MRKFYLILLSLCTVCTVMAQNSIIGYRYWFNRDVDAINNISVTPAVQTDLDFEVDIAALPPGLNVLHLQMLDASGKHSSAVSGMFYKRAANNAMITGYRYWFNQTVADAIDVEIRPTHQVDLSAALNAETLNEGLNVLHLGFYDDSRHFSAPQSYFFYKTKTGTVAQPKINVYEYWFDNDTSKSVLQEVTPGFDVMLTATIETDSLIRGLHRFNIRFQDENKNWSQLNTSFFYKPTTIKAANQFITEYEYWFNDDKENLTSVVLDTPVDPLELMLTFDMEPYPVGDYTFNFRSKDAFGMWSVVNTDTFHRAKIPLMWADQTIFCDSAVVHFFNNTDSLQFNYLWNFGDNSSTTEFAPVHEYSNPGIYTVSLTATDKVTLQDTTEHILISVGSTFMEITKTNVEIGDSLEWRGNFYKEAGTYHENFVSKFGCDSIYVLELGIKEGNRPPTAISLSNYQISENLSVRNFIGKFTTADPDEDETFTYTFTSGENDIDNASFIISGDSLLSGEMFDFEKKNTYFIRIRVTDSRGASFSRSFTIVILDIDENPVPITDIRLTNHSVDENNEPLIFLGKLSTVGGIGPNFSYNFVTGDGDYDNTLFKISNDSLYALMSFDFESRSLYFTRVQTTDEVGATYSKLMLLLVNDINEDPYAMYLANTTVDEKLPELSFVSKIITFDEDRMDHHTYSLIEGEGDADNAYFTIRNDSLLTSEVLIYEEKQAFNIRIQTRDKGGKTYSMKVIVNLNNTSGVDLISDNRYNAYFSQDMLVVKSPESGSEMRIEMYNITGQIVLKEMLESNESNFRQPGISKGVYILNFIEKDQVVQQRKMLKY